MKQVIAYGTIANEAFVKVVDGYAVASVGVERATKFADATASAAFIAAMTTAKNHTGVVSGSWVVYDVDYSGIVVTPA